MPELAWSPPPPRAEVLRELRGRLGELVPGIRIVAEGILGAEASIDLVAVEPDGRTLLVFLGAAGEDLTLVGRAAAQRGWVTPRLRDWLQLAPGLPIRRERGVRALLVCPGYRRETLDAARFLGSDALCLASYRCVRNGSGIEVLLEPVLGTGAPEVAPGPGHDAAAADRPAGPHAGPAAAAPDGPPPLSPFRTGLRETDLGLSDGESAEFE